MLTATVEQKTNQKYFYYFFSSSLAQSRHRAADVHGSDSSLWSRLLLMGPSPLSFICHPSVPRCAAGNEGSRAESYRARAEQRESAVSRRRQKITLQHSLSRTSRRRSIQPGTFMAPPAEYPAARGHTHSCRRFPVVSNVHVFGINRSVNMHLPKIKTIL